MRPDSASSSQTKYPSIRTPGIPRHVRLAIAARALRGERAVAKWLRGEPISQLSEAAIDRAAKELGVVRP